MRKVLLDSELRSHQVSAKVQIPHENDLTTDPKVLWRADTGIKLRRTRAPREKTRRVTLSPEVEGTVMVVSERTRHVTDEQRYLPKSVTHVPPLLLDGHLTVPEVVPSAFIPIYIVRATFGIWCDYEIVIYRIPSSYYNYKLLAPNDLESARAHPPLFKRALCSDTLQKRLGYQSHLPSKQGGAHLMVKLYMSYTASKPSRYKLIGSGYQILRYKQV